MSFKYTGKQFHLTNLAVPQNMALTQSGIDSTRTNLRSINKYFRVADLTSINLYNIYDIAVLVGLAKQERVTSFRQVTSVIILSEFPLEYFIDNFAHLEFPSLNALSLNLLVPAEVSADSVYATLHNYLTRFPKLYDFNVHLTLLSDDGEQTKTKILNSLHYPYLVAL